MEAFNQLNHLQIESKLAPIIRSINEFSRYAKEDLQQGNVAGVLLWNGRLKAAITKFEDVSGEILAMQQADIKHAAEIDASKHNLSAEMQHQGLRD